MTPTENKLTPTLTFDDPEDEDGGDGSSAAPDDKSVLFYPVR